MLNALHKLLFLAAGIDGLEMPDGHASDDCPMVGGFELFPSIMLPPFLPRSSGGAAAFENILAVETAEVGDVPRDTISCAPIQGDKKHAVFSTGALEHGCFSDCLRGGAHDAGRKGIMGLWTPAKSRRPAADSNLVAQKRP